MKSLQPWLAFVFLAFSLSPFTGSYERRPSQGMTTEFLGELEQIFLEAVQANIDNAYQIPLFDIRVENIKLSTDNTWASAWIVLIHPITQDSIPSEPTPSLAFWDGESWRVVAPNDPDWEVTLQKAPIEIVSDETILTWLVMNQVQPQPAFIEAISGYLLPWEGGRTVYLSRSVAHDGDFTSGNAHYSFDFYISQTMFNIHAAKSGTVWLFKDDVPNNDHSNVNYIVLKDTTTNPTTYQLYLHLAQSSIPEELKNIGASVSQGQLIGVADNTGQSTGHHLHFQVESEPYWLYWGRSVDITFDDVGINGGRPRVSVDYPYCTWSGDVCVTARSSYVSGNYPSDPGDPPFGDITSPVTGQIVNTPQITMHGWAYDLDGGVAQARFLAKYGTTWQTIGPVFTNSSFSYTWDLCADKVPNGPVSIALQIQDTGGTWATGLPGLRHVIKEYTCPPPPTCTPSTNQVGLFAEPNYQGSCAVFSIGSYTNTSSFGNLGVNNAASIRVGANVNATLFINSNLTGRGETFSIADTSLNDNVIGSDRTSSLVVQQKSILPAIPVQIWPTNGASFPWNSSLSLAWHDGGGGLEYQIEFDNSLQSWQTSPVLHLGSITPGAHTWRVRSRNDAGWSNWSSMRNFSVGSPPNPVLQSPQTAPFTDGMEYGYNNWINTGNWDQSLDGNHTPSGQISWKYEVNSAPIGYDNGVANSGDLTSPPVMIPANGFYMRFWYQYETEGPGIHWDQRWVQISINGGAFSNLFQLYGDQPNIWLQSPAIDLSAYTGSTVQFRFHFETLDAAFNTNKGWLIDDFSITQTLPPTCYGYGEPDGLPTQARLLSYNISLSGEICPGGDIDFFKFTALEGKTGISTSAQNQGSALDTYIYLMDEDGKSELISNDDQIAYQRTDSYLSTELIPGKTYYVKLRAWNHPTAGGNDHSYFISLYGNDGVNPSASIVSPPSGTFLPNSMMNISVEASDAQTGISHIDYFWHSGDWLHANWIYIGSDWDGNNGWAQSFDPSLLTDQKDIAFWVRVYDWSGNSTDVVNWNLAVDRTPPVTQMTSLQPSQNKTAFLLNWTATDNLAGLARYDLDFKVDGGVWQRWLTDIPGDLLGAWFVGELGHSYSFRIRGVDRVGNVESFPTNADATTSIPISVCTSGDQWEIDNSPASARIISASSLSEIHTFCNTSSGSGGMNDQDWLRLTIPAGKTLVAHAIPVNSAPAAKLQLYASNGTTLLTETIISDFGQQTHLNWYSVQNSTIYLKISPPDSRITGDGTTYNIKLLNGYVFYLTNIRR